MDEIRSVVEARTAYPATVASARVRIVNMRPFLAQSGVDLLHTPTLRGEEYATLTSRAPAGRKALILARAAGRLLRHGSRGRREGALTMVHRLAFLAPLPGIDPPARLDVYDFDDALFVGSIHDANRGGARFKREAQRFHSYVRGARLVVAGSPYLADAANTDAAHVEVVPSCVDPRAFEQRVHAPAERVTIGWIGSSTTVRYLNPLLPVVQRLNESGCAARLVVVGAKIDAPYEWLESRPWSAESESADLASFDIGVMPLPDDPWTRGKCGYKLLQYFAAGLPSVSSPVGIAPSLAGEGRGVLAATDAEWGEALNELASDATARAEIGAAARAFVAREYSYERWAPELARVLTDLR